MKVLNCSSSCMSDGIIDLVPVPFLTFYFVVPARVITADILLSCDTLSVMINCPTLSWGIYSFNAICNYRPLVEPFQSLPSPSLSIFISTVILIAHIFSELLDIEVFNVPLVL